VGARFYLAKDLRMYDLEYARSLEVLTPLVDEFPRNPIFQLLQGEIEGKLGRKDAAADSFRQAEQVSSSDTLCGRHLHALAEQLKVIVADITSHQ
jgi:predicted Zn-dependent protease